MPHDAIRICGYSVALNKGNDPDDPEDIPMYDEATKNWLAEEWEKDKDRYFRRKKDAGGTEARFSPGKGNHLLAEVLRLRDGVFKVDLLAAIQAEEAFGTEKAEGIQLLRDVRRQELSVSLALPYSPSRIHPSWRIGA